MPGFGSSPFGQQPFGQWPWSRQVLFDYLPEIYRNQDPLQGGVLETWTESLRYSFDLFASKIQNWASLRDPITVQTAYDGTTTVTLGSVVTPPAPIDQRGVDGSVNAIKQFVSPTGRFLPSDVGKQLAVLTSTVPVNNRSFKVASFIDAKTLVCDPPLVADAGPFRWQLQGLAPLPSNVIAVQIRGGDVSRVAPGWVLSDGASEFQVFERQQFFPSGSTQTKSLTLREGSQGQALADGRFQAEFSFSQQDVGKPLTVAGSTLIPLSNEFSNNGKYQIYSVDLVNPAIVTLHQPLSVVGSDPNGAVVYTLVPGNVGIFVQHIATGISTALTVTVVNTNTINVYLATDSNGNPTTSTAAQVASAVNALPLATALVTASFGGTGAGLAVTASITPVLGARLLTDPGPLVWALLPFPQLQLIASAPPFGIVVQEGVDLGLSGTTATANSARFTINDQNKLLLVRGSTLGNSGVYTITTWLGPSQVTITPAAAATEANLTWEEHSVSSYGNQMQALVHPPSIIDFLAQDFAIVVDHRESEQRQRDWVESVSQWIGFKGSARGYRIVGNLSGFTVTSTQLYRVSEIQALPIPANNVYVIVETGPGRSGTDGSLLLLLGYIVFASATATFTTSDIGNLLQLTNCSTSANNKLYTIDSLLAPNQVRLVLYDTATTPDYGTTGTPTAPVINWAVARQYTTVAPARPRFDEVTGELMQTIVGTTHFLVDMLCSDPNFIPSFNVNITAVSAGGGSGVPVYWTITVTGITLPGPVYTTLAVIGQLGPWTITDSVGNTYAIESTNGSLLQLPVLINPGPPPVYTCFVYATVPPALGTATLTYNCLIQMSCDFCAASRVLLGITQGTIAKETGLALENVSTRLTTRIQQETTPAHVQLLPVFLGTFPIPSLNLSLWLRSDLVVLDGSGNVSSWTDQSGNSDNAAQAVSGNRPVYAASGGLNNQAKLTFNGSRWLVGAHSPVPAGIDRTVFVVATPTASYGMLLTFKESTTLASFGLNSGTLVYGDGSGTTDTIGSSPSIAGHVLMWTYVVGNVVGFFLDGAAQTVSGGVATSDGGSVDGYRIGGRADLSQYWNGDVYEVIVYSRLLSATEISQVKSYLSTRYSVPVM